MADTIETVCDATIQHGASSNRIYLMKIGSAKPSELIPRLQEIATTQGYSKIFAKVPDGYVEPFRQAGYLCEAVVPLFYRGKEDACFMCRYLEQSRSIPDNATELERVMRLTQSKRGEGARGEPPDGTKISICRENDVAEMAAIYRRVFPSYPFPVDDPAYLLKTMRSHVVYFGVRKGGRLVALASAEMDREGANAEMTDFATLPHSLGHGYAALLLAAMEPDSAARGIRTAYTIARAASPAMNITFARLNYQFGGRLINNTQISGSIESMNVWHKQLQKDTR